MLAFLKKQWLALFNNRPPGWHTMNARSLPARRLTKPPNGVLTSYAKTELK